MTPFSLSDVDGQTVLQDLAGLATKDRSTTVELLVHIGEADERRLYRQASFSSMFDYCVRELHMSEFTALKRIRVARLARQFPAILPALLDGRLNLSAVMLLKPHLFPNSAGELLAAAAHKTNAEIELLLALRFPKPDVPTLVRSIGAESVANTLEAQPVDALTPQAAQDQAVPSVESISTFRMEPLAVRPVVPSVEANTTVLAEPLSVRTKVAPLSPGRFAMQLTVDQETHDLLREAQALLGHTLPSGDIPAVLKRALRDLVRELKKKKFADTARPGQGRGTAKGRHVPAEIRRAVSQRDGDRCTFVSSTGKRCESRARLEYDHVQMVARGGVTTIENIRLRCRAHNQFTAECEFGTEFMREKREEARRGAPTERVQAHVARNSP